MKLSLSEKTKKQFDAWERLMDAFEQKWKTVTDAALYETTAKQLLPEIRNATPVQTGRLRNATALRKTPKGVMIENPLPYAAAVHQDPARTVVPTEITSPITTGPFFISRTVQREVTRSEKGTHSWWAAFARNFEAQLLKELRPRMQAVGTVRQERTRSSSSEKVTVSRR